MPAEADGDVVDVEPPCVTEADRHVGMSCIDVEPVDEKPKTDYEAAT